MHILLPIYGAHDTNVEKVWIPWDRLGYMRIELKNIVYYGIRFVNIYHCHG